jgi:putative nucleotidyltransferase with HDIG domain
MPRPVSANDRDARTARLARRSGDLQAVPLVVTRALQCIDDPKSSIVQLAAILNRDQTLAGPLIGLANSALYSGSRRFVSVREAVIRLGFRTVRDLLFATVVSGLARSPSRLYGLGPDKLWQHSLGTAIAARVIAEDTKIYDPERGYIAGLLHDVGRAMLERALSQGEIAAIRALVREKKVTYHIAEGEILGLTHSELGAYRLAKWGIGPEVVDSVASHHLPQRETLSALVHAADALAISAVDLGNNDPGWAYGIEPETLERLQQTNDRVTGDSQWLATVIDRVRTGVGEAVSLP